MIGEAKIRLSSRFIGFRRSVTEEQAVNAAFDFVDQNGLDYVSHTFDSDRIVTVRFRKREGAGVQPAALATLIITGIIVLGGGSILTWTVLEVKQIVQSPAIQALTALTLAIIGLSVLNTFLGKGNK